MLRNDEMNRNSIERIEGLEREIKQENEGIDAEITKRLEYAIINIDKGCNDEPVLELCSLLYLPTWSTPRVPHNTERYKLETWVRLENYENSLERQSEDAKAVQISSSTLDKNCGFLFFNKRQAELHTLQSHRQEIYGHKGLYWNQPMTYEVDDQFSHND